MARRHEVYVLVKTSFHENINFISSNQRVIFFLLHKYECFENKRKNWSNNKGKKKEWRQRYLHNEDMENISLVSRM